MVVAASRSLPICADIRPWLVQRRNVVKYQVWNRSDSSAAGRSTDSRWATCNDATRDTALTWRRLVFSYQRSAFERSALLPVVRVRKSESALHKTIVSSRA